MKKPLPIEDKINAKSLLYLAKEHKHSCENKNHNCPISLIVLGELYQKIVRRELSGEERDVFS